MALGARVTLEQLLRELPRPIAVVGNGPFGDGEPEDYAREIDGSGSVLRFNEFYLGGPSGMRDPDVWVTNGCALVPLAIASSGSPFPRTCSPYHATDDDGRVLKWARAWGLEVILPEQRWADVARLLKPKPSTGLILLVALDALGIPARAYGFAGMQGGHWWDPEHEHDHPDERAAYAQLRTIEFR